MQKLGISEEQHLSGHLGTLGILNSLHLKYNKRERFYKQLLVIDLFGWEYGCQIWEKKHFRHFIPPTHFQQQAGRGTRLRNDHYYWYFWLMSASWWEKNNGGGEQDSTWRGERQCFNEVHPDSRVLVYSSAKLRDFVYRATQLWELFYCRAYIWWYSAVIQYAVQRGGALLKIEWRRPLGTTCSLSAQSLSATAQHTKRSLHKISVFFTSS